MIVVLCTLISLLRFAFSEEAHYDTAENYIEFAILDTTFIVNMRASVSAAARAAHLLTGPANRLLATAVSPVRIRCLPALSMLTTTHRPCVSLRSPLRLLGAAGRLPHGDSLGNLGRLCPFWRFAPGPPCSLICCTLLALVLPAPAYSIPHANACLSEPSSKPFLRSFRRTLSRPCRLTG